MDDLARVTILIESRTGAPVISYVVAGRAADLMALLATQCERINKIDNGAYQADWSGQNIHEQLTEHRRRRGKEAA